MGTTFPLAKVISSLIGIDLFVNLFDIQLHMVEETFSSTRVELSLGKVMLSNISSVSIAFIQVQLNVYNYYWFADSRVCSTIRKFSQYFREHNSLQFTATTTLFFLWLMSLDHPNSVATFAALRWVILVGFSRCLFCKHSIQYVTGISGCTCYTDNFQSLHNKIQRALGEILAELWQKTQYVTILRPKIKAN